MPGDPNQILPAELIDGDVEIEQRLRARLAEKQQEIEKALVADAVRAQRERDAQVCQEQQPEVGKSLDWIEGFLCGTRACAEAIEKDKGCADG